MKTTTKKTRKGTQAFLPALFSWYLDYLNGIFPKWDFQKGGGITIHVTVSRYTSKGDDDSNLPLECHIQMPRDLYNAVEKHEGEKKFTSPQLNHHGCLVNDCFSDHAFNHLHCYVSKEFLSGKWRQTRRMLRTRNKYLGKIERSLDLCRDNRRDVNYGGSLLIRATNSEQINSLVEKYLAKYATRIASLVEERRAVKEAIRSLGWVNGVFQYIGFNRELGHFLRKHNSRVIVTYKRDEKALVSKDMKKQIGTV